jgi:acyl-coenzyme A thioesterase PaaI-like protein
VGQLGESYTTLETKFNLVRPITATTGRIVCEGQVVHKGSRICTASGAIIKSLDGKLLAHGTSTCLVIEQAVR